MRLLPFLYTLLISTGVLASAPLWGLFLSAKDKHRAGFLQKATGRIPIRDPADPFPIWYHAVSVGEVMASLPLIYGIRECFPNRPVWISTVTATGQETARAKISHAKGIFYFPYDMPWTIDQVIQRLRPMLFITTETEIWPNCIWRLHEHGVPMVLVNGRISDRSLVWYIRFRFLFREVLNCFNIFCMQSDESARRIRIIGAPVDRIMVTGNLKFDQDLPKPPDRRGWRRRLGLHKGDPVFVAGSTHEGEEEILLTAFRSVRILFPELRLVLAPRAPERFDEVERLVAQMGLTVVRRSKAAGPTSHEVILLDTIGELPHIYGIAQVGFVGGSVVPHGGHNPLEVAAHARPVIFGRHMENFREIASLLVDGNAALKVSNARELEEGLSKIFGEPHSGREMGERALKVLKSNRGAVDKTLAAIEPFLSG